jgi:hypothetical protein
MRRKSETIEIAGGLAGAAGVEQAADVFHALGVGLGEVGPGALVFAEHLAGPEDVDGAPGAGEFADGFLEAGDGAAVEAEDVEELVPEGLAFSRLARLVLPVRPEADGAVFDFVPGKRHGEWGVGVAGTGEKYGKTLVRAREKWGVLRGSAGYGDRHLPAPPHPGGMPSLIPRSGHIIYISESIGTRPMTSSGHMELHLGHEPMYLTPTSRSVCIGEPHDESPVPRLGPRHPDDGALPHPTGSHPSPNCGGCSLRLLFHTNSSRSWTPRGWIVRPPLSIPRA